VVTIVAIRLFLGAFDLSRGPRCREHERHGLDGEGERREVRRPATASRRASSAAASRIASSASFAGHVRFIAKHGWDAYCVKMLREGGAS
jgi:hemin uptake protein HemP